MQNNPIEVLRRLVKQERERCGSPTVTFSYADNHVSVAADAFFSFLETKLRLLQRAVHSGDTERAVTSTIDFMCYLGAFRDNDRMPDILRELRTLTAARAGGAKRGHEGPLKQYIRDVVEAGARNYDAMLLALEAHTMVHDIEGDTLTYETPGGG